MAEIHMNTDAVENTLKSLRRALLEMETYYIKLNRAQRKLSDDWSGSTASTDFHQKLKNSISEISKSYLLLETLEKKLAYELREWEDAAAVFGDGSKGNWAAAIGGMLPAVMPVLTLEKIRELICGGAEGDGEPGRCNSIWSKPPTNAEELAYMIMNLPVTIPILIMQIGIGQYLVLLRGTTSGIDQGTNWGSAAESMFGDSSYQNSVLEALDNADIPKDATLHFAGHSQGGMVAQNLAVDPRVTDQFTVETVTMFGSPDTLAQAGQKVKYVSFEASGDIVPKLDDIVTGALVKDALGGDIGALKDIHRFHDVEAIADVHIIDHLNPLNAHGVYDNPDILKDFDIPFQSEAWKVESISGSDVSTLGAGIYDGAAKGMKNIKEATDAVMDSLEKSIIFLPGSQSPPITM